MKGILLRYLKFAGTSLAGTVVDIVVLLVLSDYVFAGGYWGEYVISPVISFQCAVMTNYMISYFYVWGDRREEKGRLRSFFRRFIYYDLSSSGVFLLRLGLLLIIERIAGWDVVICNLTAMCFSGILNFLMNNLVIFRKKKD